MNWWVQPGVHRRATGKGLQGAKQHVQAACNRSISVPSIKEKITWIQLVYYISDILYYLNAYLFLFIPINAMIFDIAVPLGSHLLADAGLLGPTWRFHVEFQFSLWDMWAQPVRHGIQKMLLFLKSSQSSFNHLNHLKIYEKLSVVQSSIFFFGCETLVLHPFIIFIQDHPEDPSKSHQPRTRHALPPRFQIPNYPEDPKDDAEKEIKARGGLIGSLRGLEPPWKILT